MKQTESPFPNRMIRLPEVKSLVGLSRATIYRLIDSGNFPRGRKLTANATAWVAGEVDAWIQSRIAA